MLDFARIDTVLFDLDDTLLANNMDVFLPHYFKALSEYTSAHFEAERFKRAMRQGTRAMFENLDPALSNSDVFWQVFEPLLGMERGAAEPFLEGFYKERFGLLSPLTRPVPFARELIETCLAQGKKVVVATNPVFPRHAIEARLHWADLPATEIDFALITSYENMHATKPHVAYYEEILATVGSAAERSLMIGNDLDADIVPARRAGMATLHMMSASAVPASQAKKALDDDLQPVRSFGTVLGWLQRNNST